MFFLYLFFVFAVFHTVEDYFKFVFFGLVVPGGTGGIVRLVTVSALLVWSPCSTTAWAVPLLRLACKAPFTAGF